MPLPAAWLCCLLALLLPAAAGAQETPPDALVKGVTEEVLAELRSDPDIRSGSPRRAVEIIETKIAPHFDFSRMTALAVGQGWNEADAEQRRRLTEQFRTLLVRTYANALTAYRNQRVAFSPPGRSPGGAADEVTVRSRILQPGARPVELDYTLGRSGDTWKVHDVTIAGISLVTNYRGSFGAEIGRGGVEGLLAALEAKNRSLDPFAGEEPQASEERRLRRSSAP